MQRPVPKTTALDAPFFAAASEGRLVLQRGADGRHHLPPRPAALVGDYDWVDSPGLGTVETCSVVERSFYEDLTAPYTVAVVRLDEGVLVTGQVDAVAAAQCAIGQRVRVGFRPAGDHWVIVFEAP